MIVRQFIKYFIVGLTGFAIDLVSLVFIKEYLGFSAVLAVVINQIVVICITFLLQRRWTFRSKALAHQELVRYIMVFALNYVLAVGVMYVFAELLSYDYRLVRVVNIACSVSWNFLLYKVWVFQEEQKPEVIHNSGPEPLTE